VRRKPIKSPTNIRTHTHTHTHTHTQREREREIYGKLRRQKFKGETHNKV